jgi:hypothetical protein
LRTFVEIIWLFYIKLENYGLIRAEFNGAGCNINLLMGIVASLSDYSAANCQYFGPKFDRAVHKATFLVNNNIWR